MLFVLEAARVGGVIRLIRVRDEIGSVGSNFVMVKPKETFAGETLPPTISFIRGLPWCGQQGGQEQSASLLIMIHNVVYKC